MKIILFLLILVSNCFSQYIPQFLTQPPVGYQINLSHPKAQGIAGRWLFHEGFGSTLFDLTPNRNDGTMTNMDPATDWVAGRDGGWALDFDASDDNVNLGVADAVGLLTNNFTVIAWINKPSATGTQYITAFARTNGASGGYGFYTNNTRLGFVTNGVQAYLTAGNFLSVDIWYQVAAVLDNNNDVNFYVDGELFETITGTNPAIANTEGDDFLFGAQTASGSSTLVNLWVGKIGDVSIFDYAFSANQMMANYIYSYAMFEQRRILAAVAAAVRRRPPIIMP